MGMAHALGVLGARQALALMAPLALLGAALASHGVERTVAYQVSRRPIGPGPELVVVGVAFVLTTAFTRLKVPTSTIQILIFSLAGVALACGAGVRWTTVGLLVALWACAPVAAVGLGWTLTKTADRIGARARAVGRAGSVAVVAAAAAASFVMGSNDVSNATGPLVGAGVFSPAVAATLGGAGLAVGVLTWGRPLLKRMAFEVVSLDCPMAAAAQAAQAVVVVSAVALGLFTSMNQALVGAMAGAGAARGRRTVNAKVLSGILKGWAVGPPAALALGFGLAWLARAAGAKGFGP